MYSLNKHLKEYSLRVVESNDKIVVYQDDKPELIIHLSKLALAQKESKKYKGIRQGIVSKNKIPEGFWKNAKEMSFFKTISKKEDVFDLIINEIYP
ncbi:MAG: hypothetical protein PF542_02420 [Nanoarchaeota archaeon]|jgi:hypothetical protein|nr:hypothetical protein [Nanoarchaeota archaeon]